MTPTARRVAFAALAVLALTLAACAAGTPDAARSADGGPISQLLLGLWHGIIAPITLLVEVVRRYVPGVKLWPWHLYQQGVGVPYDVGFYFGLAGGPTLAVWRRG